jgi:hypothetical protein
MEISRASRPRAKEVVNVRESPVLVAGTPADAEVIPPLELPKPPERTRVPKAKLQPADTPHTELQKPLIGKEKGVIGALEAVARRVKSATLPRIPHPETKGDSSVDALPPPYTALSDEGEADIPSVRSESKMPSSSEVMPPPYSALPDQHVLYTAAYPRIESQPVWKYHAEPLQAMASPSFDKVPIPVSHPVASSVAREAPAVVIHVAETKEPQQLEMQSVQAQPLSAERQLALRRLDATAIQLRGHRAKANPSALCQAITQVMNDPELTMDERVRALRTPLGRVAGQHWFGKWRQTAPIFEAIVNSKATAEEKFRLFGNNPACDKWLECLMNNGHPQTNVGVYAYHARDARFLLSGVPGVITGYTDVRDAISTDVRVVRIEGNDILVGHPHGRAKMPDRFQPIIENGLVLYRLRCDDVQSTEHDSLGNWINEMGWYMPKRVPGYE